MTPSHIVHQLTHSVIPAQAEIQRPTTRDGLDSRPRGRGNDRARSSHQRFMLVMVALIAVMTCALTGCGGYTLQGRVIRGTTPKVEVVHQMDLRLRSPAGGGPTASTNAKSLMPAGAGVGNVEVSLYRDPQSMDAHLADRNRTDGEGYFSMHLSDFGAGWMEEKWQVVTSAPGFANTDEPVKLPVDGKKWRLLITIAPGAQMPVKENLTEEVERFK